MDKRALVRALGALLQQEITRATESAERTRAGAIHEEARPENDKDTRALEASYLARGQAKRVADLESEYKQVAFMPVRAFGPDDAIELSALVQLESEEGRRWYWLAPAGGGRSLEHEGRTIDVLTPEAPLGRALVGKQRGDELELRLGARQRELSIVDVL
jgi:hypothetical protein